VKCINNWFVCFKNQFFIFGSIGNYRQTICHIDIHCKYTSCLKSPQKVTMALTPAVYTMLIFVLVLPGAQQHKSSLGGRQAQLGHCKMRMHSHVLEALDSFSEVLSILQKELHNGNHSQRTWCCSIPLQLLITAQNFTDLYSFREPVISVFSMLLLLVLLMDFLFNYCVDIDHQGLQPLITTLPWCISLQLLIPTPVYPTAKIGLKIEVFSIFLADWQLLSAPGCPFPSPTSC